MDLTTVLMIFSISGTTLWTICYLIAKFTPDEDPSEIRK